MIVNHDFTVYLFTDERPVDPPSGLKFELMYENTIIAYWDRSPIHNFGYYRIEIRDEKSGLLLYEHNYAFNNDSNITQKSDMISLAKGKTFEVKVSVVTYCNTSSIYAYVTASGSVGEYT